LSQANPARFSFCCYSTTDLRAQGGGGTGCQAEDRTIGNANSAILSPLQHCPN